MCVLQEGKQPKRSYCSLFTVPACADKLVLLFVGLFVFWQEQSAASDVTVSHMRRQTAWTQTREIGGK